MQRGLQKAISLTFPGYIREIQEHDRGPVMMALLFGEVLNYCATTQWVGVCCTIEQEDDLQAIVETSSLNFPDPLSAECEPYHKEVICARCDGYSNHLHERIQDTELPLPDRLTMKKGFCDEYTAACAGEIAFPDYNDPDGGVLTYCERHTGLQEEDLFYSFPYVDSVPPPSPPSIFFPEGFVLPTKTLSVKQSPNGGMLWLSGQEGEIVSVEYPAIVNRQQVLNIGPHNTATVDGTGIFFLALEEGLLDFAFDPNFNGDSGAFYVSYTVKLDTEGLDSRRNRLSKFQYTGGDPAATRLSEENILQTVPRATAVHVAGWVDFKPSAFENPAAANDIYWSNGDGGGQNDPLQQGQNATNLLSALVRITVSQDAPGYTIPSGNLEGEGIRPEICAYGLRNPWRCSFDKATDQLYCGDVGQSSVEEIDIVECGKNYGWSLLEGNFCHADSCANLVADVGSAYLDSLEPPYFGYCHPDYPGDDTYGGVDVCGDRSLEGLAAIGGFVYRGQKFSDVLEGAYIFGDFGFRNIYFLLEAEGTVRLGSIISDKNFIIIGFAELNDGEILLINRDFNVFNLPCGDLCVPTCLDPSDNAPMFESLGCFADVVADPALPIESPPCPERKNAMSPQICASYCATIDGSEYMGLRSGSECFCGGAGVDFDKHGAASNCDIPCFPNPAELCGGDLAMEVFSLELVTPTPISTSTPVGNPVPSGIPAPTEGTIAPVSDLGGYVELGCAQDSAGSRVMTDGPTRQIPMSAEICHDICSDKDPSYMYFGTEWGRECWCSASLPADLDFNWTGCTDGCVGTGGEMCGGTDAITVYQKTGGSPTPVTPSPTGGTTAPMEETPAPVEDTTSPAGIPQPMEGTLGPSMTPAPMEGTPVPSETPAPMGGTPAPVPDLGGYVELGCAEDTQGSRVMTDGPTRQIPMSAEICLDICSDKDPSYVYFGTEWGKECWCSASLPADLGLNWTGCTDGCSGTGGEICGGTDAITVYQKTGGSPTPVTPAPMGGTPAPVPDLGGYDYLGCAEDAPGSRVMTDGPTRQIPMSAAICHEICSDKDPSYLYFGTEWGKECWCSASLPADLDLNWTGCTDGCFGTGGEICGGTDAITRHPPDDTFMLARDYTNVGRQGFILDALATKEMVGDIGSIGSDRDGAIAISAKTGNVQMIVADTGNSRLQVFHVDILASAHDDPEPGIHTTSISNGGGSAFEGFLPSTSIKSTPTDSTNTGSRRTTPSSKSPVARAQSEAPSLQPSKTSSGRDQQTSPPEVSAEGQRTATRSSRGETSAAGTTAGALGEAGDDSPHACLLVFSGGEGAGRPRERRTAGESEAAEGALCQPCDLAYWRARSLGGEVDGRSSALAWTPEVPLWFWSHSNHGSPGSCSPDAAYEEEARRDLLPPEFDAHTNRFPSQGEENEDEGLRSQADTAEGYDRGGVGVAKPRLGAFLVRETEVHGKLQLLFVAKTKEAEEAEEIAESEGNADPENDSDPALSDHVSEGEGSESLGWMKQGARSPTGEGLPGRGTSVDARGKKLCDQFLSTSSCSRPACPYSHDQPWVGEISHNSADACIVFRGGVTHAVNTLYGQVFGWEWEGELYRLFLERSFLRTMVARRDPMTLGVHGAEVVRECEEKIDRVLDYPAFVDLVTVVHEHVLGLRSWHQRPVPAVTSQPSSLHNTRANTTSRVESRERSTLLSPEGPHDNGENQPKHEDNSSDSAIMVRAQGQRPAHHGETPPGDKEHDEEEEEAGVAPAAERPSSADAARFEAETKPQQSLKGSPPSGRLHAATPWLSWDFAASDDTGTKEIQRCSSAAIAATAPTLGGDNLHYGRDAKAEPKDNGNIGHGGDGRRGREEGDDDKKRAAEEPMINRTYGGGDHDRGASVNKLFAFQTDRVVRMLDDLF
eukprot:g1929.t1